MVGLTEYDHLNHIPSVAGTKRRLAEWAPTPYRPVNNRCVPSPIDEGDMSDRRALSKKRLVAQASAPPLGPPTPQSPGVWPPSQQKKFLCTFEGCEKSFNRPAKLTEHLRSHTNERPFICSHPGCGKSFLRENHLSQHHKSAHTDVRDHICDIDHCGKRFLTATRLKRHREVHATGGRERYRCESYPPCTESFRKHVTLQRHIKSAHLDQKPFSCDYVDPDTEEPCNSGFDKAGDLKRHQARVHAASRFFCAECTSSHFEESSDGAAMGFSTYGALQAHIRDVHPPTCNFCSYTFSSSRQLNQHLETVHDQGTLDSRRTHLCDYPDCGRTFTKKSNLNVHKRTVHEGERRFICGQFDMTTANDKDILNWDGKGACGSAFTSKAALEDHCRTQHLGLKGTARLRKEKNGFITDNPGNRRKRMKVISTLGRLTGAGYEEESGRDITCLDLLCPFKFIRTYDLVLHMVSKHGMAKPDVEEALAEREALSGGRFWIGAGDDLFQDDSRSEFMSPNSTFRHENYVSELDGLELSDGQRYGSEIPVSQDLSTANMEVFFPAEDDAIIDPALRLSGFA